MQNDFNIEWGLVEWRQDQPFASTFQDVYFSSDSGLLETDYVFLQGNNLTTRCANLSTKNFTIAETGFGTGLNFLCAVKMWLEYAPKQATLHFISLEKHPLSLQDLTKALALWQPLADYSQALLAVYTRLLSGEQNVAFYNNRVQLSLFIGDATAGLKTLNNHPTAKPINNHAIDAWFLDGFSPAKNPDMWQTALFAEMARLSNHNTTFATFTSAGAVKRGLQSAGFSVNKRAGFGKKREMLTGSFIGKNMVNIHVT